MEKLSIIELIEQLNNTDESNKIEAKRGSSIDRSILESINAFSNEPGLGGGCILLGIEEEELSLFPSYTISGVDNPDKLQLDISSQCAQMFNQPIRPNIIVERVDGKNVLCINVAELPDAQRPVYFKHEGLPRGAYRRIGSSDQRCTDDDLSVLMNRNDSFDSSIVQNATWDDISEDAIDLYRSLRSKVNAYAEELQYSDQDLLYSLGCIVKDKDSTISITYAGLLLFGKRTAHRRILPMVRVDYIRVAGNTWVEDPENRFTTIDMRGSLLEMVQRVFSQITDDLPKGFLLPEGELQASSIGLPTRVLREAIVNALIHRTYRENQPIQIIRYGNRLEIKNPGFSLKPEDMLGKPGSKTRNPFIAGVFHETNLAETKGSGIRTMRLLMSKANMLPPTFESDHGHNLFTTRLLLHHFLNEDDIAWLAGFDIFNINEDQKRALIFTKEVGAVDNSAYRQVNSVDTLKASADLRDLKKKDILEQKGKGKATYYIPSTRFQLLSAPPKSVSAPVAPISASPIFELSEELQQEISELPKRIGDKSVLKNIIKKICQNTFVKSTEIATLLKKSEDYIKREFLSPMIGAKEIQYKHPDMINHPDQAYQTTENSESAND